MSIVEFWTEPENHVNHAGYSWDIICLETHYDGEYVVLSREYFPNYRVKLDELLPSAREKVLKYLERVK